jgi:RNA polymerase sigma-70 factor (ECF subfamily)
MVLSRGLRAPSSPALPHAGSRDDAGWLARFHRGDRSVLEDCYREQFGVVERAIEPYLQGADRETAIHEVFARLMSGPELRQSFQGGSLAAWLATVARNHAIDMRRRLARETDALTTAELDAHGAGEWTDAADARLLIERFERELLRPEWLGVFRLRFLQQLPQREAAARLSIRRTTLAYREIRIRRLLRWFLRADRPPARPKEGAR